MADLSRLIPTMILGAAIAVGCGSKSTSTVSDTPAPSMGSTSTASPSTPPTPTPSSGPFGKLPGGLGQKPPRLNTKKIEEGYQPIQGTSPLELAKQADAGMAALKDAAAETVTQVQMPAGSGSNEGKIEVRDPEHVRLKYMVVSTPAEQRKDKVAPVYTEFLLRNGPHVVVLGPQGRRDVPAGAQIKPSQDLLSAWPADFPQLIIRGLVDHSAPVSAYIGAAAADPKNYSIKTEQRSVKNGDRTFNTIRLVVTRQGPALQKLGPCRVSIALEASHKVPVTVLSEFGAPGKESKLLWHANWHGPEKFSDAEFSPPK